ncbi:MAG: thioredoxin-like domain-containing protein [Chitinophagaceae bacterium]
MKRTLILAFCTFSTCFALAQSGYRIAVTVKPYRNQYVYLGYYLGKLKALADSALLDANSTGMFSGKQKLPGGIYFVVSPGKQLLFEVLVDKQQQFSITADTADLSGRLTFSGSEDNAQFQSYSKFISLRGQEMNDLQGRLKKAGSRADSLQISDRLKVLNKQVQDYREDTEEKYPSSLLSTLFRSMKEPAVPAVENHPGRVYDSLFAYRYYKSNYWNGISFTDERLLRTPIFEPRLEKYYKELVPPDPDSIKSEIDMMLLKAAGNNEMYKYLLTHFVQKYINPEYMGQDAVFVHLFERYINNNPKVDWFTEKYKKFMFERAYSLMANLIGQPASNLQMVDTSGKLTALYSVKAPFTIICFWDPTCSHCKEVVPKLDSIFKAKWKKQGIKLYGVMVDGGRKAWVQYISENKLADWIHVYETAVQKDAGYAAGRPSYKQLYDVYQTPVLYLLDKDKRIIAKKLSYQQIDEVISLKSKNVKLN